MSMISSFTCKINICMCVYSHVFQNVPEVAMAALPRVAVVALHEFLLTAPKVAMATLQELL